jgi:hypothetical protein
MPRPPTDTDEPLPAAAHAAPSSAGHYQDWKAPRGDGELLIWPDPKQVLRDTRENQRRLSSADSVRVQNVALPELRRAARAWIGHNDAAQPIVATGHQTELYHPGVWVKHALGNAAAARLTGSAIYFAVDTDSPKHLTLKWPGGAEPITDDPRLKVAAWSGLLAAPSPAHLSFLEQRFTDTAGSFGYQPALPDVLHAMRSRSLELPPDLPRALINATHELDWSLGLRHHALLASPIFRSEAFLVFVHHVLSRAGTFASAYNSALAAYRRENRVRSTSRPMPDLFVDAESVEAPFWLDDLAAGTRTRPSVFPTEDGFQLELVGGDSFVFRDSVQGFDAARELQHWLAATNHRLSPRALTLTLFLRLMVADQFVHGIGGARYDQVTDRIIAEHFGVAPPRFAVTTATMYLPDAAGRERVCLPCIVQEGHRMKHSLLGDGKGRYLEEIASLPRGSLERGVVFSRMHQQLSNAAIESGALQRWSARLRAAELRDLEDKVLFDRELFYALQPRERLAAMIQRYQERFR